MPKAKKTTTRRKAKKKRKPYNKSTGRKYTGNSYDAKYSRRTRKSRAARGRARTKVAQRIAKRKGISVAAARKLMKGKDVAHKDGDSGNNKGSNLKLQGVKANRGRREKSRLRGSKRKKRAG